jgi:tetratricopeptide (TPR) repeat protein
MKINKTLLIILLIAGTYLVQGQRRYMLNEGEEQKFKIAKQAYDRGKQFLISKSLDRAIRAFTECLEKFPKFSYADYYMAQIYHLRKNYVKALDHMERAMENHKFIADFMVNSQLAYMTMLRDQKYDLEENNAYTQRRIEKKDFKGTTQEEKFVSRMELEKKMEHAKQTIQRIDQRLLKPIPEVLETQADYHYLYANILFKLKRYQDSYKQYLEVITRDPSYGKAYNNLANLNFMGKRYKEALSYIEKAEKSGAKVSPKFKKAVLEAMNN